MNANHYQQLAARTLIDSPDFTLSGPELMKVWNALGLAGEAGEVADLVKKGIFHRKGVDLDKLKKELGDVLWYVAALCTGFGLELSDVMRANDAKLRARFPEGWDDKRAHAVGERAIEEGERNIGPRVTIRGPVGAATSPGGMANEPGSSGRKGGG